VAPLAWPIKLRNKDLSNRDRHETKSLEQKFRLSRI